MEYFPVFMKLQQQKVLVVGGGEVAERKIRLLLKAGATIAVIARELNETVESWRREEKVDWLSQEYRQELLQGMRLVFAATNDSDLNQQVYEDAEQAGIPVNVVDQRELCRFISPAVIDRSPIQVAISTGGSAPVLARMVRNWLERVLPHGLGRIASAAAALRGPVSQSLPPEKRRVFWEKLLSRQNLDRWNSVSQDRIRFEMSNSLEAAGRPCDTERGPGKVYIVGAGPGRADLLTLRAHQLLSEADVILHDRLVSEEILDQARRDAERIDVGKRAGRHSHSQAEIHSLMKTLAGQGRTVVRLKGGDPFIFGRGGEEIEVLRDAGIDYEVVPGITAASGCAAYSGIPLTHRDHAKALTFVTGHQVSGSVDWAGIAGEDRTAVVYMGVKQAKRIRDKLLEAGISGALPVALICDGTRDSQLVLTGTVSKLTRLAAQSPVGAPGLLVIGQVAALGRTLNWFQSTHYLAAAA